MRTTSEKVAGAVVGLVGVVITCASPGFIIIGLIAVAVGLEMACGAFTEDGRGDR